MRDYLRTTKITLSEEARNNLGEEYETIRRRTFGRLRLVKEGGTPIDVAYQELSELYPMYFSTETETNASAQLRQIQSVLDGLQSLKSDVFNGYNDEAAEWLSGLIMDKIYNEIFVSGETGKTNVSVDMRAMRSEMADNLQKIMGRERQWREREYNKLQERYEKKTKAYTEARQKSIKIQQIKLHSAEKITPDNIECLREVMNNPDDVIFNGYTDEGSEAFYEACGKRFDEIVDRTQVVDSTLHRSQALRSPDGGTKMVYSFMSEPLKTYNLLRSAVVDAVFVNDAQSKRALARTVTVCAVSSVVLACITGAFDTLTGDEEDEFLKNFEENLKEKGES